MGVASKEIVVSSESLVMDIQKAFNLYYPFLKIEFADKTKKTLPFKNSKVNPDDQIGEIAELMRPATINVENEKTVSEVEKEFREILGLTIRMYRKSGNVWNVISVTDNWTLENQNKAGETISIEMAAAS